MSQNEIEDKLGTQWGRARAVGDGTSSYQNLGMGTIRAIFGRPMDSWLGPGPWVFDRDEIDWSK